MTRLIPIVLAASATLTLALTAFADGRRYPLSGFDALEVSAGVTANVTTGRSYAVVARAERGDLDNLIIEVEGQRLVLSRKSPWALFGAAEDEHFVVDITMPRLQSAELQSGAQLTAEGTSKGRFHLDAESGASAEVTALSVEDLQVVASSGAQVTLAGQCTGLDAEVSSGAVLAASAMPCEEAKLEAQGGARIEAAITGTVAAQALSGSRIDLQGGGRLTQVTTGSGGAISTR